VIYIKVITMLNGYVISSDVFTFTSTEKENKCHGFCHHADPIMFSVTVYNWQNNY